MKILISIIIVAGIIFGYMKMNSDTEIPVPSDTPEDSPEITSDSNSATSEVGEVPSVIKTEKDTIPTTEKVSVEADTLSTLSYADPQGKFSFEYPKDKTVTSNSESQITINGFSTDELFNPQLDVRLNLGNQNIEGLYKQFEADKHIDSIEWVAPIDGNKAFKFISNELVPPTIYMIDGLHQYDFKYTKYWEESGMLDTFKIN